MQEIKESLVSDRDPIVSLTFVLLVMLAGFVFIGPLLGLTVASMFYEGNLIAAMQKPPYDASIFLPLMIAQGITSLMGLVVIPILYLKVSEHKSIVPFFQRERDITKVLTIIPLLGICFLIAISPITEWNMTFQFPEMLKEFGSWARGQEDKMMEMTKVMTTFESPAEFVLALIVVAVLPGIGEELVFRGLIQRELWRGTNNVHVAIWVSAFLFSAIHLQFFGFLPRLLLGALFGYLYYWSGNLLIPMVAHFFHNGFTLTMIYLYKQGTTTINLDNEESAPLLLVAFCGVATFALLYFFRKHYKPEQPPT